MLRGVCSGGFWWGSLQELPAVLGIDALSHAVTADARAGEMR